MAVNIFSLKNKVALITGGNKGIGKAIAKGLAGAGADIVIAARGEDEGLKAVEEIRSINANVLWVKTDIKNTREIDSLIDKSIEKFGRIDILINNAGMGKIKPALEHDTKDWEEILRVNLIAPFYCSRVIAQKMVEKGVKGCIVNVGSIQGIRGYQKLIAYGCSKAGVMELTKVLANEWARYGIRVNAICPGLFDTEFTGYLKDDPKLLEKIVNLTPLRRIGEPADVVGAVIFLSAESSAFLTGQIIVIDGGISL
ncbi:SDR family NAD(P)-dependent oxidoreductase [Elusimicrobiota bacterium]